MAPLTRVLKGCMKAADWGMRDRMGGLGSNVHQISIRENKGAASTLLDSNTQMYKKQKWAQSPMKCYTFNIQFCKLINTKQM